MTINDQRYRLMIESVKDYAIFMLDPKGHIVTWNEGARRFKGYSDQEIIGRHFSTFYTPEDLAANKCDWKLVEATRVGRVEDEGWRVRKDGTKFWANVVITRLDDESGQIIGFSKVTRDLSERRSMELQLQKANDELEARVEARTLELQAAIKARDEFISVASHELKTPLTALRLQAQIAKRVAAKGAPLSELEKRYSDFANHIDIQVDRLQKLVEDMLEVTRLQRTALSIRPEETNLAELVSDVAYRYLPELERSGSTLALEMGTEVIGMWDRYRLEQVVLNLLSNAQKYGNGKPVEVRVYQENGSAILSVRDRGIGIKPEDRERIFDRYERANGAGTASGLGLGLYITREIVRAHKGSISVESKEPGTEFNVQLPLKARVAEQVEL